MGRRAGPAIRRHAASCDQGTAGRLDVVSASRRSPPRLPARAGREPLRVLFGDPRRGGGGAGAAPADGCGAVGLRGVAMSAHLQRADAIKNC